MKALKSKLAAELLADPVARAQLRDFLVGQSGDGPQTKELKLRQGDRERVIEASWVLRATAKAS